MSGDAKLLIVDDDPRILSALRRALRRDPYEIFTAETTDEAVRVLETEPIDIVLSDHMMPGTTGVQLLEKAAALRPSAVRLLITGWGESVDPTAIERLGIQAVIDKPWEDTALKDVLERARKG